MFEGGPIRPHTNGRIEIWAMDGQWVIDDGTFAQDATATTVVLDAIATRPVFNLTNSGSTATDGLNAQVKTGSVLFQAGKEVRIKGAFRCTTATQDLFFGTGVIDTSLIASQATDYIAIRKLAAATQPSIVMRKASGTAETWTLPVTIAADQWNDFEIVITRDAATAGKGIVKVLWGQDVAAGAELTDIATLPVATQLPDTVDQALSFGWRAGSAANVSMYIAYLGMAVQG